MMTYILALLLQEPAPREWRIDDVSRQALVYAPKADAPAPVVFAFHGHGGSAERAARQFQFHKLWPEAIVVYMQGLPTPGMTDPDGKKAGWQKSPGDQGDRDLKFFDAVLDSLKKDYKVDARRIYASGHSNGGGFTYLLWETRPNVFAAFAPSAAGGKNVASLTPKPALHVAGEKDTTVPFDLQKRVIEKVRQINGCEDKGEEWAKGCLLYKSNKRAPFVTFIHPGDHKYPEEAPALIVRFFKEQTLP
jgi:polyhydroxybutyrate depolymerase